MFYDVIIDGVSSIIHHSAAGLDPLLPISIEKAEITRKRASNRTVADDLRLRYIETLLGIWVDADGRPTIPTTAIRAVIEAGASRNGGPATRGGRGGHQQHRQGDGLRRRHEHHPDAGGDEIAGGQGTRVTGTRSGVLPILPGGLQVCQHQVRGVQRARDGRLRRCFSPMRVVLGMVLDQDLRRGAVWLIQGAGTAPERTEPIHPHRPHQDAGRKRGPLRPQVRSSGRG